MTVAKALGIQYNAKCPDGSHEDGTCVTADPENIDAAGNLAISADDWQKLQDAV